MRGGGGGEGGVGGAARYNGIYLGLGAINDEKAAIIADNEINALV